MEKLVARRRARKCNDYGGRLAAEYVRKSSGTAQGAVVQNTFLTMKATHRTKQSALSLDRMIKNVFKRTRIAALVSFRGYR